MFCTVESTATLSKHRLYPEITRRVPGQKGEVVSWCVHCVVGHKDPTECYYQGSSELAALGLESEAPMSGLVQMVAKILLEVRNCC